jgi:hypothetical protein
LPPAPPLSAGAKPAALPPVETPAGAPDLDCFIAYEDSRAEEGWAAGLVKAVEDGWEERVFIVETRTGELRVSRGMVFYWWPPDFLTPGTRKLR